MAKPINIKKAVEVGLKKVSPKRHEAPVVKAFRRALERA